MDVAARLLVVSGVAVVSMLGAACSSDSSDSAATATSGGAADDAQRTTDTTDTSTPPAPEDLALSMERLDVDLEEPIAAVPAPGGGGLLVAERAGTVVEVALGADGEVTGVETVIDISERVGDTSAERGLLDLAVSSDGSSLFLSYTRGSDGASQLDSYALTGPSAGGGSASTRTTADVSTRRLLLDQEQPFANHNGGGVVVGPDDMVYLALGDGGSGGDPQGNGQDRTTLLGKILRLDPSASDAMAADNPFVDGADGERGEIWLTGVRNPWRFSFDRDTGDLWVADVGQNQIEEVTVLRAADGGGRGANLGWDLFEGRMAFDESDPAPGAASEGPFTDPVFTYTHDEGGCSITGGVVYRGAAIPALDGLYLFSDFCVPGLRALSVGEDGSVSESALGVEVASVVSFTEDADGEIYVISLDDGLFRLSPT